MGNTNMEWTGKKKRSERAYREFLGELLSEFIKLLRQRYESVIIERNNGEKVECFIAPDSLFFFPGYMLGGDFHCLVIEYAENREEIQKYWEDEGGQFFPEDFESKEALFNAMLKEIDEEPAEE